MIEYAKQLSSEFVFVRVDFYEIDENVYLRQLTFTPFKSDILYLKIFSMNKVFI